MSEENKSELVNILAAVVDNLHDMLEEDLGENYKLVVVAFDDEGGVCASNCEPEEIIAGLEDITRATEMSIDQNRAFKEDLH